MSSLLRLSLTVHVAGRLLERPVVQDQTLVRAGRHVEAQVRGVAGGQAREPGVPGSLEMDSETLTVWARVAFRALTPEDTRQVNRNVSISVSDSEGAIFLLSSRYKHDISFSNPHSPPLKPLWPL